MVNGPWGGYSNGVIPTDVLTRVAHDGVNYWVWSRDPGTGEPNNGALDAVYLEPGCAVALIAMLDAYHAATGKLLPVNEGYRSFAGQQYWYNRGPNPGTTPGQSNHGWAKAVDIDFPDSDPGMRAWVVANGPTYGFTPLAGDPVHFNYSGTYTGPGTGPEEEDDMYTDTDRSRDAKAARQTNGIISSKIVQDSFRAQITDLYQVRLGRAVDAAGMSSNLAAMTGGTTIGELDATLQASAEYKNRVAILDVFNVRLGRTPTSAEYTKYMGWLSSGKTITDVDREIQSTDEYKNRVK